MSGKIIGVISIKGGVGKTTVVSNLAAALAGRGKKVLAIDANFSAPNLGLHVGIVNKEKTIHEVIAGKISADSAIYSNDYGFDIMPARLMPIKIDPLRLRRKIGNLKNAYDFILIDSSPNLNEEMAATMAASDELIVVSSPDFPTLSCTLRAIKAAKEKKVPITGLVLNRVRNKRYELTLDEIENAAETPVIGAMREEEKVLESVSETKPVVCFAPKKDVSVEYQKLAAALSGGKYRDMRLWSAVRNFLFADNFSKVDVNRAVMMEKK
jgi:septum site-determining protein MinD